jgi:hypothetical protein
MVWKDQRGVWNMALLMDTRATEEKMDKNTQL